METKTSIKDLYIGQILIDKESDIEEKIVDLTSSSVLITRTATSDRGINCKNWFIIEKFDRFFKIK